MTAILTIVGVITLLFIIKVINSRKQNKSQQQDLFDKINLEIFPNGQKDIDDGTKRLLEILNNRIDQTTATNILVKTSCICYISTLNNTFSKERLKQHLAPYALHYFDDSSFDIFYKYLISKNPTAKFIETARILSNASNPNGTEKEEMPEGYGEFGLEATNPIPVNSIPDSYLYLSRLRTQNGSKITYTRIGSTHAPNIKELIDVYEVSVNGNQIATIFICAYNKNTSSKAPKGFRLS